MINSDPVNTDVDSGDKNMFEVAEYICICFFWSAFSHWLYSILLLAPPVFYSAIGTTTSILFCCTHCQLASTFDFQLQSGASSLAKHGGAYFSAVYGSIQDPIAAPGLFDIQVP